MNIELAYGIFDMLQTMQDAVKQMKKEYVNNNLQMFNQLSMDLWDSLIAIQEIARAEIPADSRNRLADACVCALASLKDTRILSVKNPEKVEWKLEYELAAILETMTLQFYYWGIVNKHPEERNAFCAFVADSDTFRMLKIPPEEREYIFDLTIYVFSYNHLNYTKQCIDSILENLPKGISYEIVLMNHGSSDGTKEYFESIEEAKVINIAVNGALPGVNIKAFNGRYLLVVSNDIIIGKNSIDNLYRGITENKDYGYVVPTTPAVSNLQTIPAAYHNSSQFTEFVNQNNVYDVKRHEQRVRLCNPVTMILTHLHLQFILDMYEDICCCKNTMSFPDDKLSLWMRRHGYKNILAKDAYCHHFGSVTSKEDFKKQEEQQQFYLEGRKSFYANYGIDPWGPGFCFDYSLFNDWTIPIIDNAMILGINCGIGSNSLKVKETLKENGAVGTKLYNCVQKERYLQDLRGVSDETFLFSKLEDVITITGRKQFHYIIVEETVQGGMQDDPVQNILNAGLEFDELAYRTLEGKWNIVKRKLNHRKAFAD